MTAPVAPRKPVVDRLHGIDVTDPYRWLEDGDAAEVTAWVDAQNERTRTVLDSRADRARWHEQLVSLMQLPVVLAVELRDQQLFCLERPAGSEQFVLTVRSATDRSAAPVVLFDPASGTGDDTTAIDWFEPSHDGDLVAIGTSEGGTEESVLRVIDGTDGSTRAAVEIPNTRACSVAWEPDASGFAYTRYPEGDQYHRTVHSHRLGDDWHDDAVVWADHPDPQSWPDVSMSPDGRWLLVHVLVGWSRFDVHVLDRTIGTWTTIISGKQVTSQFEFAADGRSLVGVTTLDAPRGRIVRVELDDPTGPWTTLVEESDDVLSRLTVVGDELWAVATRRAVDRIVSFTGDGSRVGDVNDLGGGIVAVAGISGGRDAWDAFAVVDSFNAPTTVWRASTGAGAVSAAERWFPEPPPEGVVPALTVTQANDPSRDGTDIGMFLIHRVDVTPGADTPAILNGYGGFAISETPVWSPQIASWCAAGGTYAIAGLRGGLEEGEEWHHAGRRANKQNVFDDFHAGADWLVAEGLVDRRRLGIVGRSNGGLLVGVALTQRPDLCRAVVCGVPLLDMVRFPEFLIARLWTDEYGDPDVAEELAWLHAYSPYHHVVEGTDYPAVFLATAEGDSRVDPLHARKMAALLQWATASDPGRDDRPILLFQEGRAGHGVGKPVAKRADELADQLTFLGWQLRLGG